MKVADIKGARKAVVTVSPSDALAQIASTMRRNNVGAVVVCDPSGRVEGIVTERDIVSEVGVTWPTVVNRTASQLMSHPVLTCGPEDRVSEVMRTMLNRRVRHLPLVEDGHLAGMISMGDVVKSTLEQMESEANILRDLYISASSR